jgi:putative ABC transport system permease protein
VIGPRPHSDVRNLRRVDYLPALLAVVVALLAVGTVAHALVSSVRRRRRDMAILKTLGFVRGLLSAMVAWQATTFALVALLAGLTDAGTRSGGDVAGLTAHRSGNIAPSASSP